MTILLAAVILSVATILSPRLPSLPRVVREVVEMATPVTLTTIEHPTATPQPLALAAIPVGRVTLSRVDGALRPTSTAATVRAAPARSLDPLADHPGASPTPTPVIPTQNRAMVSLAPTQAAALATPRPMARGGATASLGPSVSSPRLHGTMPRRGPGLLRLWNGAELDIEPASGRWDDGVWQWELPAATDRAGWHTDSDDCGQGVTVISGHSAWGRQGALMALNGIGQDDEVLCVDADGQSHRFAPMDFLLGDGDDPQSWHPDWPGAVLILYTCRPDFSEQVIVRFQEVGND
jgi:hypothetical protein